LKPVSVTVRKHRIEALETGIGKPAGKVGLPRTQFDASNCAKLCQHS